MRCPGVLDLIDAAVRNGADLVRGTEITGATGAVSALDNTRLSPG
jgi:hypothetical protein